MSFTFTVTLHLWWLWVYLAIGAVLWLPLGLLAARRVHPRKTLWQRMQVGWRRSRRYTLIACVLQLVLWPVAAWETLR